MSYERCEPLERINAPAGDCQTVTSYTEYVCRMLREDLTLEEIRRIMNPLPCPNEELVDRIIAVKLVGRTGEQNGDDMGSRLVKDQLLDYIVHAVSGSDTGVAAAVVALLEIREAIEAQTAAVAGRAASQIEALQQAVQSCIKHQGEIAERIGDLDAGLTVLRDGHQGAVTVLGELRTIVEQLASQKSIVPAAGDEEGMDIGRPPAG